MSKSTNWDLILDTIEDEKCILLLGPEICVTDNGQPFEKALLEHLNIQENEDILTYYDKDYDTYNTDGLFLFKDGVAKTKSYYKIKEFFRQGSACDIYTKIAQIPFHLIISTTPDLFLLESFKKNKIRHAFSFYDKTTNPKKLRTPTQNTPLLYNLFGSIEKEESLILTHDDLFDFLLAIFGSNKLPTELNNSLQNAKNFIFLGFKFDKWYVQLLLRLLHLHQAKYGFVPYASNREKNPAIEPLCINQFKIEFVDDKCNEFINNLFKRCENKGILRKFGESEKTVSELVEKYIEDDKLDEAFTCLKDFFDKKRAENLSDDITGLMGRYNSLVHKKAKGEIDEKDAITEENKIRGSLIQMIKEVKSKE